MVIYEYPFNERIRILLRLELLHERFSYFLRQTHPYNHHVALTTIFEIIEIAGRADLKADLLQELEKQKQTLLAYRTSPNIQEDVLESVLQEIDNTSKTLLNAVGKTGQSIRENEWLMSIRSRNVIPGGLCQFDMPSYFAWQHRSFDDRMNDIINWYEPMRPLINAIALTLRLLRASGIEQNVVARNGYYQQMLQGRVFQILRLRFSSVYKAVPEASANKYMMWFRFTTQEGDAKPMPYEKDVPCEITLC